MPSIYSSLYQNFIRQGSKSFVNGYAQSVVAATQHNVLNPQNRPSFARRNSTNTTRIGRLSTLALQSAFHPAVTAVGVHPEHRIERATNHGGLDAYFENLQKTEATAVEDASAVESEWVQYQFPKRIEWKPSPASILLEPRTLVAENATEDAPARPISPEEEAVLAKIDAALEREIEARSKLETLPEEEESALSVRSASPALPAVQEAAEEVASRPATPVSGTRTPASIQRTATPPPPPVEQVDPQSLTYSNHLTKLAESARYTEIPVVFEAMLVAGVQPTPTAYNALLTAAIQLPRQKIEVVSKALDVYADMLRRKVAPDSDTYNILVGLLASRSLEVGSLKTSLEEKRARFGGMDEPGRFMLASHELEHAILSEDDRLDLAIKLFDNSVLENEAVYSSETYHELISACAQSGRVSDMLQLFEHMEHSHAVPFAATFPAMITAFAVSGDLVSAVECYSEYKTLAVANDNGLPTLLDRLDVEVYAAVINAYVISDKLEGAMKFYEKIIKQYGVRAVDIKDAIISAGFVQGFLHRGIFEEALMWAQAVEDQTRAQTMSNVASKAADSGDMHTAVAAFANLPQPMLMSNTPTIALLALSVRQGDVAAASRYWNVLSSPEVQVTSSLIEPTAMYAVAMIGSGQVAEGLTQSEMMFERIRALADAQPQVLEEVDEASEFVGRFMAQRGIADPREVASIASYPTHALSTSPFESSATTSSFEDTFDPYAHNTDFKGSSLIADDLEGSHGRKGPKLNDALNRFRNIRRAGRHPRYITYAKLISAAARDGKMDLCNDILAMAAADVPLQSQYAVVRYGWSSILDAMVGACLTLGNRPMAEQYHIQLLSIGASPSANTFGLYITTLKESTKTFDEASEAVKIFQRAKAEGVEPTSFLYNALIGKLGKARRIDDCLFYFAEMRALAIRPTSVTYGTIVNALCRVSDDKFAEELFDEMESMPNYKARPAPYNSMMQFFLTTKRDKSKVLSYYERMMAKGISPTAHTYKLLVDTHATLEPVNMTAAEAVLDRIRASGQSPEPVHYASLIHARGCVLHDMAGAQRVFDSVMKDSSIPSSACLFQALFEAMVANHRVADTTAALAEMRRRRIEMTPYIANTLIHGWAAEHKIDKAREVYEAVGRERREPSTYEAMTRAYLAVEQREGANGVVTEMLSRGYPSAVVNKVLELLGGGGGGAAAEEAAVAATAAAP
ncbi:hypothetical protein MAPG_01455 [Magnaporthiopsis poae ATCC 64411]|uniref:Tetratricopeptide repeat domain-containing protein n=1 Tax=Magnaporthiopsis poae (strain ATCC 64411 / 73-15) TaxID=644358 RepID=A0A0C4DNR1_MAGP6|nr:hypothetical protein MAPG_01455 [Magnaporthiopsis poae ATCC 64411]